MLRYHQKGKKQSALNLRITATSMATPVFLLHKREPYEARAGYLIFTWVIITADVPSSG